VIGEANASTPPQQTHEIFVAEEEISDVSLATFYDERQWLRRGARESAAS